MKKSEENYLRQELYQLAKEDETLFDFITNFSLHGLWFWDLEQPENEYFNDQFWYTLGYDPKEMPHSSSAWQGMIDPKDAEIAQTLVAQHIENPEEPYRQLIRYTHRDGRDVWIRCLGKVIFKEGKPARMLGVHIDVSDEIRASADLQKYFEEIRDLVLIGDHQGRVTSANRHWEQFNLSVKELVDRDFFDLLTSIGLSAEESLKSVVEFDNRLTWTSGAVLDRKGKAHFFEVTLIYAERRYFLIAHEISEKRYMLDAVKRKQALLDLLLVFSSKFIDVAPENLDNLINQSLESVGDFVKADRAYIFNYDFKASTTSNTHEWCAKGIDPEIENLQDVPMEAFPDWLNHHLKGHPMIIPRVDDLEESNLKVILESQHINSLVAVPVMLGKRCLGFVGFDWVTSFVEASYEELQALEVLARMLSHVETKRNDATQLLLEHAINKNIIEHIGYPLVVMDADTREHVLVNESFEKLCGYKIKELEGFTPPFPYWLAETEADQHEFNKIFFGQAEFAELNLISKKGRILPVRINNHPVFADQVKTPLIILGIEDLSEQKAFIDEIKKEKSFNQELLAKSPFYFLSIDRDFNILRTNQAASTILKELGKETQKKKNLYPYFKDFSKSDFSGKELVEQLLADKKAIHKLVTRLPQREEVFLEWSMAGGSVGSGGETEILVFGEDVSFRENFIRELERSRTQLKAAQELAMVGNFTLDLKQSQLELSDTLKTILPLNLKAKLGLGLEPISPKRFGINLERIWSEALSKNESAKMGYWFEVEGIRKFLAFRLHRHLNKAGEIEEVFGTIQDLTEIKTQEQALQEYRDRLMFKSNLLTNILSISRYLSDDSLSWDEVIHKSFRLLRKDIEAETAIYLKRNSLEGQFGFDWKLIFNQGQEIIEAKDLKKIESLQFGSMAAHQAFLNSIKSKGYLILEEEEDWVPFSKFRMRLGIEVRKITLFPIVHQGEVEFIWGFIEKEKEPWDQELLDTLQKLSSDFSRTYGLRQSYLLNQESVKNYELISEATGAAIWQVNLKDNSFTKGSGFRNLLGYKQEVVSFNEEAFFNAILEIDRKTFRQAFSKLQSGEIDSWQGSLRYFHAEGEALSLLVSMATLKNAQGEVYSVLGSFSESPDFLKDSSLLEKAASVTHLAAWELDTKGPSIRYTDYLKNLLNLPADYKIDFNHLEDLNKIKVLIDQEWIPYPEAVIRELEANPQGLLRDYQFKFPGDSPDKWLRVQSFPISGRLAGSGSYMGVIQDITESVLDKQKILEASHWLEKAQKVGKLGYFLLDYSTKKPQWKVSEVLGDLLEITADEEVAFGDWLELVIRNYREPLTEAIELAFESGRSILKRCEVYSAKSQKRLWLEISGEIQRNQKEAKKVMLGTIRDITDTMVNVRSMDEQNKRLREIAWAQSHLVRAPLTRMHGLLDEINTGQLSDKERALFFEHFKDSIGELDGIVKDVIKKAQILEEEGILAQTFTGSYSRFKDIEVHLVDDDPIIRTLQERVVLKSGLVDSVSVYASGKDFLEYIEKGFNPNHLLIVLLDLNMPDLNGWDVLEKIKALDLEEQIIVVVTTSSTDTADLRLSYKYSSVIEYIEKPLNYSKMTRVINLAPIKEVLKNKKQALGKT